MFASRSWLLVVKGFAMKVEQIRRRFKSIDTAQYPELNGLSRDQIYAGRMGPGGLFLASDMARRIPLANAMRVMDLGCGRANTSCFLARTFGVAVSAVDLWISEAELLSIIRSAGFADRMSPFNLDITKALPFADGYFDAIFCMDAFHYFGSDEGFLVHIARILKPGGHIVVGNPCFDREFGEPPPPVYREPWAAEFSRYHSPGWWRDLFARSGLFKSIVVDEPPNGEAYWEDDVLHQLEGRTYKQTAQLEADTDQIVYGRDNPGSPRLTHYILSCTKR